MASGPLEKDLADISLKSGGESAEVEDEPAEGGGELAEGGGELAEGGGELAEGGGELAEGGGELAEGGGELAEGGGELAEGGGELAEGGDELAEGGGELAEFRGGFVVCERTKLEEFKVLSSEIDFDADKMFLKTFSKPLEDWDYRLEVTIVHLGDVTTRPTAYVCLVPYVDHNEPVQLSDYPLVDLKQSTYNEDLFYNFRGRVKYRFPQTVDLSCRDDITVTVSAIPYIESTNGTCEVRINLREYPCHEEHFLKYIKPRGKPYFFLTSPEGYLVRINVFYVRKNFYAQVRFIAGPYDEKLSNHFPHLFYAIVKHERHVEQSFYAEPVFKQFEQSIHGDWSCVYDYNISTYEAMADKRVLTNDKLLVRFCVVPIV